jgi:HSP20 family protein
MSKDEPRDKDDSKGAAGFAKIARGLSDLFTVLSDFDQLPRHGRHEKDGKVMEYSFRTRSLAESSGNEPEDEERHAQAPSRPAQQPRRAAKPASAEIVEPVMDVFDEPGEVVLLFELPGIDVKGISCVLDGDILVVEANSGDRHYRKETLVEAKLEPGAPRQTLRNGVLEVRLTKQQS